ncbi:CRISPR-associated helicase/endonuclease Cas3 [Desulfoplanes formicivorans]|uniref:CRISPR-associated protein Cas3 n=1 Tax=Desulfoplanes formicivorans TaxID=1592317 RepID=A0A194AJD8_9BACT|nr:CRISPR-associated helicase/endonuclease Cas3 [Desulfoplanes formicivorans]GAU09438.1 CRISPR-associated protein Cas3 [Desulfoplanes formicivorans]
MKYYAHSSDNPDKSDWQRLEEHLQNVAALAASFAEVFGAGEWGRTAGLLHDAGKATHAFQRRLEGQPIRVNHSIFGARLSQELCGKLGLLMSYIIAGHHGGLPDGGIQEGQLHYRLKHERIPDVTKVLSAMECPVDLRLPFTRRPERPGLSLFFFVRMIFSCLTDADFLDTEAFCDPDRNAARTRTIIPQSDLGSLQKALNERLRMLEKQAVQSKVNMLRRSVLHDCRIAAEKKPGFFSLSVPTGGGKTLSSMAFALDHAVTHGLRRVIYAIPFTSIIEQNAQVFCSVFGRENVLEHHSNYKDKDTPEKQQYDRWRGLAVENWDAPVVVTTNVQFFESLFSNKPSRCRKLHNIARSVIVLDEAQAIPTEYLESCLCALRELVDHYGCSVVLCTATQPALDDESLCSRLQHVREIVFDSKKLYAELKRTEVKFEGALTDDQLSKRIARLKQVLCIVSTKAQARNVFELLPEQEGTFHLSTNMYPVHRRRVLDTIGHRLEKGLPCRVISTSLIEAGVDVDFPVVYRAMAGLDSIAQAAGRCNREGRMNGLGRVVVFEPEKPPRMPWLQRCASRAGETLRTLPAEDPLGLVAMRRYFELLYDVQDLDKKQIVKRLDTPVNKDLNFPFKEIAQDFRFIEDEGTAVIIPGEPETESLLQQLQFMDNPRSVLRRLQQYVVTVRSRELAKLYSDGAVEMIRGTYPVLRNMAAYSEHVGLCVDGGDVWHVDELIL